MSSFTFDTYILPLILVYFYFSNVFNALLLVMEYIFIVVFPLLLKYNISVLLPVLPLVVSHVQFDHFYCRDSVVSEHFADGSCDHMMADPGIFCAKTNKIGQFTEAIKQFKASQRRDETREGQRVK